MSNDQSISGINSNNTYTVNFCVNTKLSSEKFPLLCGNKKWDDSDVIDLISNHNMGLSLASGQYEGWSLFVQPNGAWGWNIGDGENRLDYLPTALQIINDGKWHEIAISFHFNDKTVWLYYDNRHVAIYSLSEINFSDDLVTKNIFFINNSQINIKDIKSDVSAHPPVKNKSVDFPKNNKADSEILTVMSWNIWHGGRHNGIEKGIEQVISTLKNIDTNIICMQETYGSGPFISDALGTIFYYRSSNLSIHSKYEIAITHELFNPFRFGGIRIIINGKFLDVFVLWINYLPEISKLYEADSVDKIISDENETRGSEIKEILGHIQNISVSEPKIPMIIGGDFNSPSHLDWGNEMKPIHQNLVIEWPVSKSMIDFGFKDSFRERSPLPYNNIGNTFSSLNPDSLQHRIDYLYYKGNLKCVNCFVKGYEDLEWPSDHAAVVGEYRFP
ncbi:MAG: hypothetical protein COA79_12550 [Planctomycetota bacterium]|nr:MAG: hypothetical protein COA79_12550 [Planctomycetota bacterium]